MSQLIPLDLIDPSPTQPRTRFRKLDELAASIKALGIQDAITVRVSPANPARFELIDGERRVRAAKIAAFDRVPAEVVEMDDATIILAQLAHNDAEPLTPVEEGGAYRRLIDDFGQSTEDIALNAGVARSVVWARVRLTFLVPELRALVDEERISQSSAQLLALEPTEVQDMIADDVASLWPTPSSRLSRDDVRNLLDRHVRRLDAAPFNRTEATLVDPPLSCEGCHHNTATQRSLLPDEGEEALCMRRACWDEKVEAAWVAKTASAERTHLRVLTQEEAVMALDGARVRPGAPWVCVDDPIATQDMRTWRDLERELADADANGEGFDVEKCALARSGDHFLVLLDAPYAAVYVEKAYPDRARELRGQPAAGVEDDREERRREKEQTAAQAEVDAAVVAALEVAFTKKVRPKTARLVLILTAHAVGKEACRLVCVALKLQLKENGAPILPADAIDRHATELDDEGLASLSWLLIVAANMSDDSLPQKPLSGLLDLYGVDPKGIAKELKRAKRNVTTRKLGKKVNGDAVEAPAE